MRPPSCARYRACSPAPRSPSMPSSNQTDRASPAAAWTWLLSRFSGTVAFADGGLGSLGQVSTVDWKHSAGDEGGLIRGKKDDRVSDFLRFAEPAKRMPARSQSDVGLGCRSSGPIPGIGCRDLRSAAALATARQIVACDQTVRAELIRKRLDRLTELDTEIRTLERRLRAMMNQ